MTERVEQAPLLHVVLVPALLILILQRRFTLAIATSGSTL